MRIVPSAPLHSGFPNTSNLVSFSSHTPSHPPPITASQQIKTLTIDSKSMLHDSDDTKFNRPQIFATQLKQSIEAAQNRTGNDENDHAIKHTYQAGNQQRLFFGYRPDELTNQFNSHETH